ncbi:MAG: hypothetical protein WC757_01895 [Candidatus Paceibacterota bacterium]
MNFTSLVQFASSSGVHINLDSAPLSAGRIVWAILILVLGICALLSYALVYHWKSYGNGNRFMKFVQVIYFVGVGVISAMLIVVASLYSLI